MFSKISVSLRVQSRHHARGECLTPFAAGNLHSVSQMWANFISMVFYVDVITESEAGEFSRSFFLLLRADYETSQPDAVIPANGDGGALIQYKLGQEPGNLRVEDVAEKSVASPGERIRLGAIALNDDELRHLTL